MSEGRCFAYSLHGSQAELASWAGLLGADVLHWVADSARLHMGAGVPSDWREQGAVFGPGGELRWWRDGQGYRAVLLLPGPAEGLSPLSGQWTAEEWEFELQDLADKRLRPLFETYPNGSKGGRARACIYRRDGVPVFVSPRGLQGRE